VHEKRGLADTDGSGLSRYRDCGCVSICAATAPSVAYELVEAILSELRLLKFEEVTFAGRDRCKRYLKGSLMLSPESSNSRMAHLAKQVVFLGCPAKLEYLLESVDAVSIAGIQGFSSE